MNAYEQPIVPDVSEDSRVPHRASRTMSAPPRETEDIQLLPQQRSDVFRQHWQHFVLGMVLALVLLRVGTWGIDRWNELHTHWQYGDARISQLDADVGHGGVSHFIAFYWHGSAVVIEFSNGDPRHYHVYTNTILKNDTTPRLVTLHVQVIDGKHDLLVSIEGLSFPSVLYNTGSAFSSNNTSQ